MQIHSLCWYILSIVHRVLRLSWDLQDYTFSTILQGKNIKITLCLSPAGLLRLYSLPPPFCISSSLFCLSLRAIMVSHKEFVGAGKQPGLQVWRIENLDLKPVPKALHGCFYTGDAYLLLFTTSAPSYNIHMWLGKTWTSVQGNMLIIP